MFPLDPLGKSGLTLSYKKSGWDPQFKDQASPALVWCLAVTGIHSDVSFNILVALLTAASIALAYARLKLSPENPRFPDCSHHPQSYPQPLFGTSPETRYNNLSQET